jgi:signal transduction histidine kinase/ActR/RegA family two-component response regulator
MKNLPLPKRARALLTDDRTVGPALTVFVALVLFGISFTPLTLANRFAPLLVAVIYAAFRGGSGPGFVSAVIAVCYLDYHFHEQGLFIKDPATAWGRLVSWMISFPIIVHLVGKLKKQILEKEAARQTEISARIEAELRASERAAVHSSRMKSEFLANMSHEIRTPINGVMGMASLLLETALTQEQRDFGETIRSSADTLLTLVNDILDFSKVEAGKMELELIDFGLADVLHDIERSMFVSAKQKGLKLFKSASTDLPEFVQGDPTRLRQVLVNLVNNAIKFTAKGQVVLEAAKTYDSSGAAWLRFEVTDTGIGIPQAVVGKIFDAFAQADSSTTRRYGGSGLGLSICKRLVELMHGEIGVVTEVGKGSTFWFSIPLVQGKATPSKMRAGGQVAAAKKLRVLIAEDNSVNRVIAIKMVEKLGHSAIAVTNGVEAIDALRASRYDLVLMDCQMPELDGYEATRTIRTTRTIEQTSIPIIAMTANALQGDRERCLEAGMNEYVSKPMKTTDLRDVIDRILLAYPQLAA